MGKLFVCVCAFAYALNPNVAAMPTVSPLKSINSPKTAHIVADAGADVLVAGSAVYDAEDPAAAIESIREKAQAAYRA